MKSQEIIDLTDYLPEDQSSSDHDDHMTEDLPSGTVLLHGQYKILGYLKAGGFGITYLAIDSLNRQVVVKECFPGIICERKGTRVVVRSKKHRKDMTAIVDEFVKEAQSLANLDHPNIVSVHQAFEENSTAYLALDFIDGQDLLEIAEDETRELSADDVILFTVKLLRAISHVHDNGILHRDISPDNILIDKYGEPVLIDFGAARVMMTPDGREMSKLKFVKDGYSPQEFYSPGEAQGPFSDIYSFAASLYHVISGEPPVSAEVRLAEIAAKRRDPYRPMLGYFPDFTDEFLSSLDKALSLFPGDRFQSAEEWLEELDPPVVQSRPISQFEDVNEEAAFASSALLRVDSPRVAADLSEPTISPQMGYLGWGAFAAMSLAFSAYVIFADRGQNVQVASSTATLDQPEIIIPDAAGQTIVAAAPNVGPATPGPEVFVPDDVTAPVDTAGETARLSETPDAGLAATSVPELGATGPDATPDTDGASPLPLNAGQDIPALPESAAAIEGTDQPGITVPTETEPAARVPQPVLASDPPQVLENAPLASLPMGDLLASLDTTAEISFAATNDIAPDTFSGARLPWTVIRDLDPARLTISAGPRVAWTAPVLAPVAPVTSSEMSFAYEISPIGLPKAVPVLNTVAVQKGPPSIAVTAPPPMPTPTAPAETAKVELPSAEAIATSKANSTQTLAAADADAVAETPSALPQTLVTTNTPALAELSIAQDRAANVEATADAPLETARSTLPTSNAETVLVIDATPPSAPLQPLLDAQVLHSHWDVAMPFVSEVEQVRNATVARITEVDPNADLARSGEWIQEGVVIYAMNGAALTAETSLEGGILNEAPIDPDGYSRASVRYLDPETGAIVRGLLAVPVIRQIGLADGTEIVARIEDQAWALIVTSVGKTADGVFETGDMIVQETQTQTTLGRHEDLSAAFAALVARKSGEAEFTVLRDGALTKVRYPLARKDAP